MMDEYRNLIVISDIKNFQQKTEESDKSTQAFNNNMYTRNYLQHLDFCSYTIFHTEATLKDININTWDFVLKIMIILRDIGHYA